MAVNKEALREVVTELTQSLEIISRAFYMGEQEPDLQVWEPCWSSTSRAFRRKGFQIQEPPCHFCSVPHAPDAQGVQTFLPSSCASGHPELCTVPPRPRGVSGVGIVGKGINTNHFRGQGGGVGSPRSPLMRSWHQHVFGTRLGPFGP